MLQSDWLLYSFKEITNTNLYLTYFSNKTIRLFALNFSDEAIVNKGEALVNCHLIESSIS